MSAAAAWATRHARAVLAVSALLALAAAVAATRIPTDAGIDTLVDTDTASYQATQDAARTRSAKTRWSSSPKATCGTCC